MNFIDRSLIATMSSSGTVTKHYAKLSSNLRTVVNDLTNVKYNQHYVSELIDDLNLLDYFNVDDVTLAAYSETKPIIANSSSFRYKLVITVTTDRAIVEPWHGMSVYSSIHKIKHNGELLLCDVSVAIV